MSWDDDLEKFEARGRRRRRVMAAVAIALGVSAVGVFAFAAYRISKSDRGVKVMQAEPGMLSAEELAAVEKMGAELQAAGHYDRNPALGLADVICPAGTIGIPESGTIRAFCVDDHDVTNRELLACVDAGKCPEPITDPRCGAVRDEPPDDVAHCADYASSVAYCQANGRRFLELDEWERALRLLGEDVWLRCANTPGPSS